LKKEEYDAVADSSIYSVPFPLLKSRGDAKRLLTQRAIEIDGKRVNIDMVTIRDGMTIQVGKRRFVKIVDADKKT